VNDPCSINEHDLYKQKNLQQPKFTHYLEHKEENHGSSTLHKIAIPQQKREQSTKAVYNFLINLQLEFYFDLFLENGFNTLQLFKNLNEGLLERLGITRLGYQLTLLSTVKEIQS
jgi:hypothetical protein